LTIANPLPALEELAGERLAVLAPGAVRLVRVDPAGLSVSCVEAPEPFTPLAVVRFRRAFDEREPAVGAEQEDLPMFPRLASLVV